MARSQECHVWFSAYPVAHGACGHGSLYHHESLRVTDYRTVLRVVQRHARSHEEHKESKRKEEVNPELGMALYLRVLVLRRAEAVRERPEVSYMWIALSASCSNTDDLGLIRATVRGIRVTGNQT